MDPACHMLGARGPLTDENTSLVLLSSSSAQTEQRLEGRRLCLPGAELSSEMRTVLTPAPQPQPQHGRGCFALAVRMPKPRPAAAERPVSGPPAVPAGSRCAPLARTLRRERRPLRQPRHRPREQSCRRGGLWDGGNGMGWLEWEVTFQDHAVQPQRWAPGRGAEMAERPPALPAPPVLRRRTRDPSGCLRPGGTSILEPDPRLVRLYLVARLLRQLSPGHRRGQQLTRTLRRARIKELSKRSCNFSGNKAGCTWKRKRARQSPSAAAQV